MNLSVKEMILYATLSHEYETTFYKIQDIVEHFLTFGRSFLLNKGKLALKKALESKYR